MPTHSGRGWPDSQDNNNNSNNSIAVVINSSTHWRAGEAPTIVGSDFARSFCSAPLRFWRRLAALRGYVFSSDARLARAGPWAGRQAGREGRRLCPRNEANPVRTRLGLCRPVPLRGSTRSGHFTSEWVRCSRGCPGRGGAEGGDRRHRGIPAPKHTATTTRASCAPWRPWPFICEPAAAAAATCEKPPRRARLQRPAALVKLG